jgi:hypothetical protein
MEIFRKISRSNTIKNAARLYDDNPLSKNKKKKRLLNAPVPATTTTAWAKRL